jgi:hypothetical protein
VWEKPADTSSCLVPSDSAACCISLVGEVVSTSDCISVLESVGTPSCLVTSVSIACISSDLGGGISSCPGTSDSSAARVWIEPWFTFTSYNAKEWVSENYTVQKFNNITCFLIFHEYVQPPIFHFVYGGAPVLLKGYYLSKFVLQTSFMTFSSPVVLIVTIPLILNSL